MKILVVDDNANNRMVLKLLLEDYQEDEGVEFSVDEAKDGLDAVQKCKNASFDLVFMDIMMPNMDGIEATKIIRQTDKTTMIIAVSAVDDCDRKKLIMNAGAEDYISKPVNADIFVNRLKNYLSIREARGHEKNNTNAVNLFTNEIFSRHTNFIIKSEDSLAEFWEFFLLSVHEKNDSLSDVVRVIFSIAEAQVKLSINSSVIVEESDDVQYFTLTKIDKLPAKLVSLVLKKNKLDCSYKIGDSRISFALEKIDVLEESIVEQIPIEVVKEVVVETPKVEETPPVEFKSQELVVYNYLEEEDLYDLEEYAAKLSSLMLMVGSGDIIEDEVMEIYAYLDKIGSILSTYTEVYDIAKALSALSADMSQYINEFIKNSVDLGVMCKAFSNDMSTWIQMSFHTGAPSIDFMNDTIVVNCETISGMLKAGDVSEDAGEDLDDIFDF